MDIKEIRVGATFIYADISHVIDEFIGKPVTISANDIAGAVMNPNLYEPIPLSPEILKKCGFEKIESNVPDLMHMKSFDGQRRFRYDYEGVKIESVFSGFVWPLPNIKYLHQLQGLFYSLTGKELEINL